MNDTTLSVTLDTRPWASWLGRRCPLCLGVAMLLASALRLPGSLFLRQL